MKKKLAIGLATLFWPVFLLSAANIYWVSFHSADDTPSANASTAGFTNAPDAGYTRLLAANGHTVTRYLTTATPDTNVLNTADLVILSRSNPSGNFQNEPSPADWNGITAPMMIVNGYLTRGSRLGITTGDSVTDANSDPMRLRVIQPSHPMFSGIALDANNLMVNPYAQIVIFTNATTGVTNVERGISVNTSAIITGGMTLATVGAGAAAGGMVIGEFPQGLTARQTNYLGNKRLVFFTGSREHSGLTGEGAGIFDLLPDGQKLFLNAVDYLLSKSAPQVSLTPTLLTNLWDGDTWTFAPTVFGTDPISYQWYKDEAPIAGATGLTYALPSLVAQDAGGYHVVATNPYGSATSAVARLEFAVLPSANITNGIISYWPLNEVVGNKTVDLVSGYDMTLVNMGLTNVVPGKWGNAFQFDNASQTILQRIDQPGEDLPIYSKSNFTVSLWVMGGYQTDHRVFSEASTAQGSTLFNIGTDNRTTGFDASVDNYIRNDSGATAGDHRHSTAQVFDYANWHHIAYVHRDIGGGQMKAYLFIDGAKDPVVLYPMRPLTPNTTSIGGILRAQASAWFTGNIDEVAVWDRALTPQEIQILQVTQVTNAPSRLQPLAINSFKADLPAVATGGSTVLRWDVSKDATQVTIDQGVGDVTSKTVVGLGATSVTLTNDTTYVLTVKRGVDTLTATTTVAVVDAIAPGWALLDNFDRYPVGPVFSTGYWIDPRGNSAQILDFGGNRVLRTTTSDSIVYLNLQDLTIPEASVCSLFFRIIVTNDSPATITNIVGLTDKTQRNYGDEFSNIGSVLYPTSMTNDLVGIMTNAWYLGARNYPGGGISYPPEPIQTNTVYNVWIDITNATMGVPDYASDTFSVYTQKDGAGARTLLFQDYVSDRDLYAIDPVLGGMRPILDKLVVMGQNAATSALFDDFYLSKGAYNATVPRPYGFTGPVGPLPPLQIGWSGTQLEIRWTTGILQESTSVSGGWSDVPNAVAPSYKVTPGSGAKFYRARP
ncbi:MAG TPA: LamG-like jellyroll fold domain-containing protein [Verrucomicrobiae bacterium]